MEGTSTVRWMSPLKLFEYMSYGLPLIVPDYPVLREFIRDKENAILTKGLVADEWIRMIKLLDNDLELRKKLSINSRKTIESKYNWNKRVKRIIEAIN